MKDKFRVKKVTTIKEGAASRAERKKLIDKAFEYTFAEIFGKPPKQVDDEFRAGITENIQNYYL